MTMQYRNRSTARGLRVLAIIAALIALAACGESGDSQSTAGPQTSAANATTRQAAPDRSSNDDAEGRAWRAITGQTWPPGGLKDDQSLARDPLQTNIMVILDMSGSMAGRRCAGSFSSKAAAAREALKQWVSSVSRSVNLGLVTFSLGGTRRAVPLGRDNRDAFTRAALSVSPGGNTPLKSAMQLAVDNLTARARAQLGYGRYQIVTITDGEYSPGENPLSVVDTILDNPANPIGIYTIGFCLQDSVLRQPGRVQYQSANDPAQLAKGLSRVLAESESFKPLENFDEQ